MPNNGVLTVRLESAGNPDFGQDPRQGLPGVPELTVAVKDMAEASNLCRSYIETHGLGAGNWAGGLVCEGDHPVARVSYNGKVWPVGEWFPEMGPLYSPWPEKGVGK